MEAEKIKMKKLDKFQMSNLTFVLYSIYLISFFLNLPARIPALGTIRFTLLLFIVTSILILLQLNKLKLRSKSDISKALNIFLAFIACSWILTTYPLATLRDYLPTFVKAIAFFYLTSAVVDSKSRVKKTFLLFALCTCFRVLEPLYLNLTEGYWGSATYLGGGSFAQRLSGSPYDVINSNELAFLILNLFPFLYYFLFEGQSSKNRILFTLISIPLVYALILTMSRGGIVFFVFILFLILKNTENKKLFFVLGIISLFVFIGTLNDSQRDRYLSIFGKANNSSLNTTSQGRIDGMVSELVLGLTTAPIIGNGIGTTAAVKFNNKGVAQASHNFYAELIIEVGLIGLFLFLNIIIKIYKNLKTLTVIKATPYTKTLTLLLILYSFYSVQYFGLSQFYWYFLGGLTVALARLNKMKDKTEHLKTLGS